MLFSQYQQTLKSKFEKLTDTELIHLESKLREGNEIDAANTCSDILLARRNRPIMMDDEYPRRIGMNDEDYFNDNWK